MSNSATGKIPILIASTLKPVRDSRAFEKLAQSLGETNKYEVNIIGFSPEKPDSTPGFRFFSSMSHFHSIWDRVLAQVRFSFCLFTTRPQLLIVCTFELLPLASLFKLIFRYKLIYDVQENYLFNLTYGSTHHGLKLLIGKLVIRWAESLPGVDFYFLAEKCYAEEMPDKKPRLILENKFKGKMKISRNRTFLARKTFIFSITGTLSRGYGTNLGVAWFKEILSDYPDSILILCGHVPVKEFEKELRELANTIPQIQLNISENPVPHEQILEVISSSDFCLLPYPILPSIQSKIPTKLFECAALRVPVLITENPVWENFFNEYNGGISVDFQDRTSAQRSFDLAIHQAYFNSPVPSSIFWDDQVSELIAQVEKLLSGIDK